MTTIIDSGIDISRGVDLLDEHMPGWWQTHRDGPVIDTDRLDLFSSYDCVLGQLHPVPVCLPAWQIAGCGSADEAEVEWEDSGCEDAAAAVRAIERVRGYNAALVLLGIAGTAKPYECGFEAHSYEGRRRLTAAWRNLIISRRERAADISVLIAAAAGAGGSR